MGIAEMRNCGNGNARIRKCENAELGNAGFKFFAIPQFPHFLLALSDIVGRVGQTFTIKPGFEPISKRRLHLFQ